MFGRSNTIQKRTRASGRKVRTGCLTCKIRHVKCDEQRPECVRCINMGLRCAGYKHLARTQRSRSKSSLPDQGSPLATSPTRQIHVLTTQCPLERRAIEYFYHKAAPQLSGYFHRHFWSHNVFQIGLEEPAVRHAMIALSSIYENDCLREQCLDVDGDSNQKFALEAYNRAIRHVVTKLEDSNSIHVPLITCIIFVCIDCLRRDIPAALKHVGGGLRLLEVWRENNLDRKQQNTLQISAEFKLVEETLVPMFAWLRTIASMFGLSPLSSSPLSANSSRPGQMVAQFQSIDNSITSMFYLTDRAIQVIQASMDSRYSPVVNIEAITEQAKLVTMMSDWQLSFAKLVGNESSSWSASTSASINIIITSHISLNMWLEACLSPYETAWDKYKVQYEELLRLAESVIDDPFRFPDEQSKFFSFELGIVPTLQFVAWKCRWPLIRRRALALLRASPRRESVFDAKYSAALYERIMTLEESALGLTQGQTPEEGQLPPETARIHRIHMPPLPPTPNGRAVNFLTKPFGVHRGWHVRSEYLNLNGVQLLKWFDEKDSGASDPGAVRWTAKSINRLQAFAPMSGWSE